MAFKKKPEEVKAGLPEYMGTYGDMITLVLCFFVMLFAMSTIDAAKFAALAESYAGRPVLIEGSLGDIMGESSIGLMPAMDAPQPSESESEDAESRAAAAAAAAQAAELESMASDFKTYLSMNVATSKITVDVLGDYMRITFPDGMLFDSGKAAIKPEALGAIESVADELLNYSNNRIRVEGHTDTIPMNTVQFPSNRHLSSFRADTVVEYLVNEKGFDPMLLSSEGMSEYFPVDTNETAEGRAKNRRVEIKVYAEQSEGGLTIPMD